MDWRSVCSPRRTGAVDRKQQAQRFLKLSFLISLAFHDPGAQELPQHADPEWVSSRAEDRSCSAPAALADMPPSLPSSLTTPDHVGGHPFSLGSENSNPHVETISAASSTAAVPGMPEGRHGTEKIAKDDEDMEPRREHDDQGDGGGERMGEPCVTLAITTCKRLRAFLGTAEGLQARYSVFFFEPWLQRVWLLHLSPSIATHSPSPTPIVIDIDSLNTRLPVRRG